MNEERTDGVKSPHILYLILVGLIFAALTVIFLFFPRARYSELEKRDLATFPQVENYRDNPAGLTAEISRWFSDSEPYRDRFMTLSMTLRDMMKYRGGDPEEAISYKPSEPVAESDGEETDDEETLDVAGNPLADANAKISNSGTIVVGSGDEVRALMAFGGSSKAGGGFIETANAYAEAFPRQNIYAIVAPLATEFYLPDKARNLSKPQKPVIDHIRDGLESKVKFVDVYNVLAAHTDENIYLRTDHHWAPLGAYYAAMAFAKKAGVPFKTLDSYEENVIHRFVGSMYGYTKDIAVKNAPEDFIYYKPENLDYSAQFITYNLDKNYRISSETKPYKSDFFKKFRDGSSNAYLTFMGSDQNLVKVTTGASSPRKLLVIKDSYGNALPGFLFYSFGEVHVVDFRYFPKNLKQYVADNGITDILLAFNIFNACNSGAMKRVKGMINQPGGYSSKPVAESVKESDPSLDKSPEKVNENLKERVQENLKENQKEPEEEGSGGE